MEHDAYEKGEQPAVTIKTILDRLFPVKSVFEVRIPKTKYGTISGYFDDTAVAASLISKLNGKHPAIYVTANPVIPALVARNWNKFEYGCHTTTTDNEITRRHWFLVDLDPVRAVGISSTEGELEEARRRAVDIQEWLTSLGWPIPIVASSGNGYHLMYRTDEPNDEETRVQFESATKMLASIFTDDKISVDTTVWNASRIWKLYGTIACKGSDTADRPHRIARVKSWPTGDDIVPRELIEGLARPYKDAKTEEFKDLAGEYIADMEKWLVERGLSISSGPRPLFASEGRKWTITRCPFNNTHTNPVIGLIGGRAIYRCLHNSCSAFRWKEFREKVDPTFKDPETIFLRLKEWCHSDAESPDPELLETSARTGTKLKPMLVRLRKEVPRERFLVLEEQIKLTQRRYVKDTYGENNDKGNLVGLMNRTKKMQAEGVAPMFWTAEYDHRIRVGTIGDISADRLASKDEIELMIRFHALGDSWVKQVHTSQIIQTLAAQYVVNPMKQLMKTYKWDGVKRLTNWLVEYMGANSTEYTRAIGRKWMISAVARGMDPGCQADHMLILEGKQGIGKSRALRILGGPFYIEYSGAMKGTGTSHKDMVAVIVGKSIVEMSELATLRKADMESLKAILTTVVDDARLSYERDAKQYPRTCVFAGTTNEMQGSYIADASGARRFWPFEAGMAKPMNLEALKRDRDQLWAEAVEAYENGEDWWTVPEEETLRQQAERQVTSEGTDPWHEGIRQALTDPEAYEHQCFSIVDEYIRGLPTGKRLVRAGPIRTILGIILGIDIGRQSIADSSRVRAILRTIGFEKTRPAKGGPDGGVYAMDMKQEKIEHLWTAIETAAQSKGLKQFEYPKKEGE